MKYFLDTEFLEGNQNTLFSKTKPTIDLISIGIVNEEGREYYAISKEFNLKEAWNRYDLVNGIKNYWIRENVLKSIFEGFYYTNHGFFKPKFTYCNLKKLINKFGKPNKQIAEEIVEFIYGKSNNLFGLSTLQEAKRYEINDKSLNPEFYAYYADYDWVVFCWLFGYMKDLPKGFPMYCKDLKQESDRIYNLKKEEYIKNGGKNFINNMSNHLDYPKQTNEHNALDDARWNKELYKFLKTI